MDEEAGMTQHKQCSLGSYTSIRLAALKQRAYKYVLISLSGTPSPSSHSDDVADESVEDFSTLPDVESFEIISSSVENGDRERGSSVENGDRERGSSVENGDRERGQQAYKSSVVPLKTVIEKGGSISSSVENGERERGQQAYKPHITGGATVCLSRYSDRLSASE